ncbi:MAG TPA: lipid A biosynthesis acyltransferase [Epsilonproteobacteria bacterium]|nr:lipid A biosynthesis acyltransferase [Campylobacterota bacterium]
MKDMLYVSLFYSFKFIIWFLPDVLLRQILKLLARGLYTIDRKHRYIAKVNLDLAYEETLREEEKIDIIKATYLNLLFVLVDFVKNQGISKEKLLQKVTFHNTEAIEEALQKEQKIILVTAHYGNWELLPLSLAAQYGPLTGVGRKLDSSVMDSILNKNRKQFNIEMLEKKGAMREMISVLKNNRMLGLLVDQNTSENEGILVDFFGKPVRHTPAASILARRFDAVILPAFITSDSSSQYEVTFYDPIYTEKTDDKDKDILESVQKQAKITEEIIRAKPEEWFWLHKRWKNQFEEAYA